MNTELLEKLPIIELDNPFMSLNENYDNEFILNLINKYIIFERREDIDNLGILIGKLLDYKDNKLLIDILGISEWISLDEIRGIDEYKSYNESLIDFASYEGKIIRLINYRNEPLVVLFNHIDEYELSFFVKVNDAGKIKCNELIYYKNLITKIEEL